MLHKQIPTAISDYATHIEPIKAVATAGHVLIFNHHRNDYLFRDWSQPDEWREEYEQNNYQMSDPTVHWAILKTGARRWSKIQRATDFLGVMKKAERFGLNYGAIFVRKYRHKISMLTVARSDREVTDDEMDLLQTHFNRMVDLVVADGGLTEAEKLVLIEKSNGHSYQQIAERQGITVAAVKKRATSAWKKMGCRDITHAVAEATRRRYI